MFVHFGTGIASLQSARFSLSTKENQDMIKKIGAFTSSTLFLSISSSVMAAPITLDFEGIGDNAFIQDFYNGGTDSDGNSGIDYGISFGSYARGLIDRDAGGQGNFANEPTPDTTMYFLSGSAVLDYAPGFDSGFSFFYTTSLDASVTVWDGLGATGTLLGQIDLFTNNIANDCVGDPQGGPGDPYGQFCHWDVGSLAFSGTAKSIDFSGTANQVGFDNITFGSIDPTVPGTPATPTGVAAPPALTLLGIGLIGVGFLRRRV